MVYSSACVDGKASCSNEACEHWSEWGPWSECDVTCGEDGVKTTVRECLLQDDLDNFEGCPGADMKTMNCTLLPLCEGLFLLQLQTINCIWMPINSIIYCVYSIGEYSISW